MEYLSLLFAMLMLSITMSMKIGHNNKNMDSWVEATSISYVPIIYYPGDNIGITPPTIQYYKIYQCSGANGDSTNKQSQLSIILPDNVGWNNNDGYILAELSTSPTQWDNQHVFGTNYIWNGGINPILYSNITWTYNSSTLNQSYFYLRITAKNKQTICSFEITYLATSKLITGKYDSTAFKATSVPIPSWESIHQFARTVTVQKVANNNILLLQVNFCKNDMADNYDLYYSVIADSNYAKSAFNTFICSGNSGINCNLNTACVESFAGAPVGFLSMSSTNSGCDLTNGVLFGIYGVGGNADLMNYFEVGITMSN